MKLALMLALALCLAACGGGAGSAPQAPTPAPRTAILIGDSLTEHWPMYYHLPSSNYTAKGISGQWCKDIADRFQSDVVAAHPSVVVIWCGTNDVVQPTWDEAGAQAAVTSMLAQARAAGITPILATIPPMRNYMVIENPRIVQWNSWLRQQGVSVADYYPLLVDGNGELRQDLADGDVHLNAAAYAALNPILAAASGGD